MTAAVRPAPRPVATRPAPARGVPGRPPHPPAGRVHHEPHPPVPAHSTTQRLMIGGGILAAVVVAVAVLYAFGSARNLSGVPLSGTGAGAGDGRPSMETTLLYRDMRDGTVMVMEMDRNGTRVVGIRSKEDIPMAGDMYRDRKVKTMQTPSASDRVNALGSAFR